ncbi:MAG: CusA/CzcA family heavy metal efflux RND transporter [Methylococcaceae bacterium]|nr:CusA/CzcA family heavy metal efflux RND transporter [Methylococcaceae bacterium]
MDRLIHFALTQRLMILVLGIALSLAGVQAGLSLPIDAFPDVSPTQVKIIVKSPGMTPEEVETRITAPIEIELLGIPNQTMLRSIAYYALTDITLDFQEGTDIYWARQQVAERINGIWDNLPEGVEGGIAPMTTPLGEMFMFTLEGDGLDLQGKRELLDWVIRPALRTVEGVADVNALGGLVKTFEVKPDPARMAARGISMQQLVEALTANNRNDGAGRLSDGEEAILVRAEGRIESLEDVRDTVVETEKGMPTRVSDIASVEYGFLTRYGAVSQNGRAETVEGLVLSLRGSNAKNTVAALEKKLDEIKPSLPEGIELKPFYNRGDLVEKAVKTVGKALLEAVVLVLVLLFLFLGSVPAAVSVAIVLPLAACATFIMMHQIDLTANLMSLGGLAIAIGMLVDAAVVVVENISEHLSHSAQSRLPRLHIIYRAVKEVAVPVTTGILIIMLVFVPLLTLEGLEGKLFSPVAKTIVLALASSLIMAFTMIPVTSSYLITHPSPKEPWLPAKLAGLYAPILDWSLVHPKAVYSGTALLFLTAVLVFGQIGKSFMPTMDEGDIVVQLEKLPSISLQQSVRMDMQVQKAILERVPEVRQIISRVGVDEIGLDPMGLNDTDAFFVLDQQENWLVHSKEELIDKIRGVLDGFAGIAYGFTQPIQMRVTEMLTGVRGDVAIKLFGADLSILNAKAAQIADLIRKIPGASDVFATRNEGVLYSNIVIDRTAAGRFGLDVDTLEGLLRAIIEGRRIGTIQEGIKRTPLNLKGAGDRRSLTSLTISLPDGRSIPFSEVARFSDGEGVVSVSRERGQRYSVVRCNVTGRDLVSFVDEAKQLVARSVKLPTGYYITWGGQFENQQRAAKRLMLVVPIAIGLIFLLLFTSFGSVRQAFLVLANIPLALIGGVFALGLSGEYLSVPASVGFIALLGIAVLNGVVLVGYFNQLRSQGCDRLQTVIRGAKRRLRPVLMTASIAAFGLTPLLFATGPGSEIQRPLAIVVIGGLITSTLLTLLLLPILYHRHGQPGGALP